jgi:hypothetical protein
VAIEIAPTAPFPDAEAVTIDYLLTVTALTDLVSDRIGSDKGVDDGVPVVRVTRPSGSTPVPKKLDKPTIQVDVWADTDANAFAVAAIAHAALSDMPELLEDARAVVTDVRTQVGIRQFPDTQTDRPRYEFEVGVYIHARSGS